MAKPDVCSVIVHELGWMDICAAAASVEAFDVIRERLVGCGASDGFVTDFGPVLSIFFRDPDGLEGEVCVPNPDARPGVHNPPGTPAARYAPPAT